jgi:hypothetical protein
MHVISLAVAESIQNCRDGFPVQQWFAAEELNHHALYSR